MMFTTFFNSYSDCMCRCVEPWVECDSTADFKQQWSHQLAYGNSGHVEFHASVCDG